MGIKVSIITVCYNAADTIEDTILSIENQSYENIEYIVIDGGSTDGTLDIIDKHKESVSYFVSEPDNGIYDAMNKGIINATGEWLSFMNAGDVYTSDNTIESLVKEIPPPYHEVDAKASQQIRIVRGNIIRDYANFTIKSSGVTIQNPGLMDMFNNTFHHQACLIQRSLFKDYGLYAIEYKLTADWKFFFDCVILHHVRTKYIDIDVARFMMDGVSSKNVQECEKEQKLYLRCLLGDELYNILNELNVYRKSSFCRWYCKTYLKLRNGLSPKNFNRVLTLKRLLRSKLGLKVN